MNRRGVGWLDFFVVAMGIAVYATPVLVVLVVIAIARRLRR